MSNFQKLGNALIDFDQVRLIKPFAEKGQEPSGICVVYHSGSEDVVYDVAPLETMNTFYQAMQIQALAGIPPWAVREAAMTTKEPE